MQSLLSKHRDAPPHFVHDQTRRARVRSRGEEGGGEGGLGRGRSSSSPKSANEMRGERQSWRFGQNQIAHGMSRNMCQGLRALGMSSATLVSAMPLPAHNVTIIPELGYPHIPSAGCCDIWRTTNNTSPNSKTVSRQVPAQYVRSRPHLPQH